MRSLYFSAAALGAMAACVSGTASAAGSSLLPDVKQRGYVGDRFAACVKNQVSAADRPTAAHFCDFASAGATWNRDSAYRVWLPRELAEERK